MDIKKLIFSELNKKHKVAAADLVKKTGFSRAYIHRFFKKLQDEGRVCLVGRTNGAFYVLPGSKELLAKTVFSRTLNNRPGLTEDVVLENIKKEAPGVFKGLTRNAADIFNYAFTEILNNAIEHSKSKKIFVAVKRDEQNIEFKIFDWGVGVFNNIQKKFRLKNQAEAIEHLLKGKQTTQPQAHTGEGLFFTSRVADVLGIKSFAKKLIFDNKAEDIFAGDLVKEVKGTKVSFKLALNSAKNLQALFQKYAEKGFAFVRTDFKVRILELGSDFYVSRSQARRLLFGLDKFKHITLDFKKVSAIGQGFADEVFRVWQKNHPGVKIDYLNANESITFMIKRAVQD